MSYGIIDIGNSRIKVALFESGKMTKHKVFTHLSCAEVGPWLEMLEPEHVLVSSTAASYDIVTDSLAVPYSLLSYDTPLPISSVYEHGQIGPDRIANAVAGHINHPAASLVIDLGSCITYDWTVKAEYLGGSISPGHAMRMHAMHHFTGKLPELEATKPDDLIGKNTKQSMYSGAYFGIIGEIKEITQVFLSRYDDGKVLLTGGDSLLFAGALENDIFADPFLTLKGLEAILRYNHE